MPLLQLHTSAQRGETRDSIELLKELSVLLARELGKPEAYVMVSCQRDVELLFGGSAEPACFATLKNIGTFTPAQTEKLSALLGERLSRALGVATNRIYIEFVDAQAHLWGYDGGIF